MSSSSYVNRFVFLSLLLLALSGCTTKYAPVKDMAALEVKFADPLWDGVKVPALQQCNRFGGQAETPRLTISNIPGEANAVIMEYSDRDDLQMNNGGHGKIGYTIAADSGAVTTPAVKGHSFELPENVFLVSAHANPGWDKAGAYMPPCSGGRGNRYYVTVKAVYEAPEGEQSKLLGQGKLELGKY